MALIWVLSPRQFTVVASVSTLLMVAATAANSALPWVLAKQVATHPAGSRARREAIGFTLGAALAGGVAAAGIVTGLASPYASVGVEVSAAVAVVAVFVVQVGSGYLQGAARFVPLAVLGVVEVFLKTGFGLGLAVSGLGATGAVAGAAAAACVWAVVGLGFAGRDIALPKRAIGSALWRETAGIGGVQVGVVALTTLDVVIGSILQHGSRAMAGYLAMLVFARIPLFIAGAVSAVAYPRLVVEGRGSIAAIRETMTVYVAMAAAVVAVVTTIPAGLIGSILPSGYARDVGLLVPLGLAGLAAGQINLITTLFQADSRFASAIKVLWPAIPAAGVVYGFVGTSVTTLAWASLAVVATVAVVLTAVAAIRYRGAGLASLTGAGLVSAAAVGGVLAWARASLALWLVLGALAGVAALVFGQRTRSAEGSPEVGSRISRGIWMAVASIVEQPAVRRRLVAAAARAVERVRPLAPPTAWQVLMAARSAAGEGPVVCPPSARRALVVAPHPDDESIGCGATAALLARGGCDVSVVVATSGAQSAGDPGQSRADLARCRREEAVAACRDLGTRPPLFLGLPDGGLERNVAVLAGRLREVIAAERPEVLFVPWPLDAHPDHQAVSAAVAHVELPPGCHIWSYEVWASLPANRVVDVTEVWDAKVAALGRHASAGSGMDVESHLALSRWRSIFGLGGQGHAEAFLVLDPPAFRALLAAAGL